MSVAILLTGLNMYIKVANQSPQTPLKIFRYTLASGRDFNVVFALSYLCSS